MYMFHTHTRTTYPRFIGQKIMESNVYFYIREDRNVT